MHHATRTALTIAARFPRGTARLSRRFGRWITDADYAPVVTRALESGSRKDADDARASRARRIRERASSLCFLTAVAGPGGAVVHALVWPYVWQTALAVLVLVVFAAGGRPRPTPAAVTVKDKPVTAGPVTSDAVAAAFKIALPAVKRALETDPASLRLVGPVHRDGPGWAATVDLPPGVTGMDCIRAREPIASALRVAADQLYLSPGRHAGQCRVWVADVRPEDMPPVAWPHAAQQALSLVEPVTIGSTVKGSPVTLSLATRSPDGRTIAGGSMLVGGVSGSGKTTFMRLIVSAAALDPAATIAIFDGKGDGDYRALEPVCDWIRVGADPDNLADLHAMLTRAQEIMRDRQKGLAEKTPLLIVIDEVQRVKDKDTQAVIEDLLRIGRSSGVFLVLATQKPSAETLPTDLRDSVRTRVCLKVHNQQTNDMILGTGAYSDGRDATKFTRGLGLLLDVDTDAVDVVRVANVTDEIAARIAADHAREPGRLFSTGPAGEVEEPVVGSLLDQVRGVWPDGAERVSTADLAGLMGWEPGELTRALKARHGVITRPLWIDRKTQRGLERADVVGESITP